MKPLSRFILYLSATFLVVGAIALVPHGNFLLEATAVPGFWRAMAVMNAGFVLSLCLPFGAVPASIFWFVAIATRMAAIGMYPGDDVWRYLWEGYIQTQGVSPYDFAPDAAVLEPLRQGWWSMINHKDVSAIYPPLTQLGFWLISLLSSSVHLFKLGFIAADLGICALLSRRFGHGATLLYAWNPLVIYCFAGGAHYDSWFLLPLVMAWLWWDGAEATQRRSFFRALNAAFWLGCSIAAKWMSLPILSFLAWQTFWPARSLNPPNGLHRSVALSLNPSPKLGRGTLKLPFPQNWGQGVGGWGLVCVHARNLSPFSQLRQAHWFKAAAVCVAGLLPVIITALPYCSPSSCPLIPTGSTFVSHGRSAEWIPYWVAQHWPLSLSTNSIYAIPLMMAIAWLLLRARSFGQFAEWYLISLLLISPIIHAWYFTWLAPFAVTSRNWGTKLVSISAMIYFVLPYQVTQGNPSWWMVQSDRLLLWLPFCIGLLISAVQAQLQVGPQSFQPLLSPSPSKRDNRA